MPNIRDIQGSKKFQNLDYSQKRSVIDAIFSQDNRWSEFDDNQKEAIFQKVTGTTREQEFGEIRQGVSQGRETAADAVSTLLGPLVEGAASVAGSATAAPLGPVAAAAGGALGYAGVRQGTRGIESLLRGTPEKASLETLVIRPLRDLTEGLAGEVVPIALIKGAGKAMAPLAKKFGTTKVKTSSGDIVSVPSTAKKEMLDAATSRGIDLTPAEISGSKTTRLFETFLEKLPKSSDVIQDFRLKSQLEPLLDNLESLKRSGESKESVAEVGEKIWNQVNDFLKKESTMVDDQLNMIRDSMQDILGTKKPIPIIAEEAQEALIKQEAAAKAGVREKYKAVDEALPTEEIDIPSLKKASGEVLEDIEGLPAQSAVVKQVASWAKEGGEMPKELLEQIKALPEEGRADVMKSLGVSPGKTPKLLKGYIETLNSLIKKEDLLQGLGGPTKQFTKEGALFTKLKVAAREDLESISKSSPKSAELLKSAKESHIDFAETFKTKEIQKLLKSKPSEMIDRIIIKDDVQGVRNVRKAMGAKGFDKIKQGLTNKLLGVGKKDVFDPKYLGTQLAKYETAVLEEVYGKDAVKGFKNMVSKGLDLTKVKPGASFLKTISKEYPGTIVDSIIGAEETKLTSKALLRNAEVIKKAISEKEFNALGDKLFEKIMSKDKHTKLVNPIKFAKTIEKYDDRLAAFYPKDKVDALKEIAEVARELSASEKLSTSNLGAAQLNLQWGILNMMMSIPGARVAKKAAAVTLLYVPKKLAQFYTSPAGRKYLTEGYKIPKTDEEMIKAGAKLATLAGIDLEENNKKENE